jgi:hypothetical protein
MIGLVRSDAFNQRIIRGSFKERGIWLVNSTNIMEKLANQQVIPNILAPDLRAYDLGHALATSDRDFLVKHRS